MHSKQPPESPFMLHPGSGYWPPVCSPTLPTHTGHKSPNEMVNPSFLKNLQVGIDIPGLFDLLEEYRDIFASKASDLGACDWYFHNIDTGDAPPEKSRGRQFSPHEQSILNKEVDDLLAAGIVRE